jgi:alkylation response protein AidB-like acyl-CoA dehydrogenase
MTTFLFTDEQQDLRQTLRRFLTEKSPPAEVRRLMETETGYDPAVWKQLTGQLGLASLAIPERYGGSGYGPVEQLIACEEMGRALFCAPYLASVVLAAGALLASGDEQAQAELLPGIADGSVIATLAVPEQDGSWVIGGLRALASRTAHGYLLDGSKSFVLDGLIAGLILVAARTEAGPALFAVDGDAPGLTRRPLQTLDMTRKQAELTFGSTPARLIGAAGEAEPMVAQALLGGVIALCAEQAGGAQRCLDMSVEYAKLRVQFGRPIGSFQAIKHKCADMLLEVESAKSAAYYAAWAAADSSADLPLAASIAKAYCSEAYSHAAAENIQIHGGIGFTWEHDAHLYYRRARSAEVMFGSPAHHREVAATHLIDAATGLRHRRRYIDLGHVPAGQADHRDRALQVSGPVGDGEPLRLAREQGDVVALPNARLELVVAR